MIFSLIDYYIIFFIFFLIISLIISPIFYYSFSVYNFKKNDFVLFHLNLVKIMLKMVKIVLVFVLIFFALGCKFNFNDDVIYSEVILKNFYIFSKIIFFLFLFIFLIIFEYYVKLVKWYNSDVVILFYISIVSLYLMFQVESLFNFYLILEMYSLSILGCICFKKTKFKTNIESLIKYFFINAVSSCFVLFGISIIYSNSILNNFLDLKIFLWMSNNHPNFFYINIGIFFFLLGLFIKLSAFPFNYWFIDIYNNISIIFTIFLLIFPKFVLSCFLFMFYLFVINNNIVADNMLMYFSLLTLVANILISFYQTSLKKLIIVTSFSNLPFLVLFIYFKSFNFIIAFFGFLIIYYINLIGVFIFLLFFINLKSKKGIFFKKITSLNNLFKINKKLSYMLCASFLSLAGFPPLSGFFGKLYFLIALITTNNIYFFVFFSFMNLLLMYVYLRLIKIIFQNKNIYFLKFLNLNSKILAFLFVLTFFFNISFILYFDVFYNFIKFFLLSVEWIYNL